MLISVEFDTTNVNQREPMPLKKKDIAEAVGWKASQLSRGRFKSMPEFDTVDEFKQWEVTTRRRGTSRFADEVSSLGVIDTKHKAEDECDTGSKKVLVDWKEFQTTPEDHLDVTLERGMHISNMAWALIDVAVKNSDIAATFGAIKNWSAALREESEVRSKLLQQQLDQRSVIALDEVKHVTGLIIGEIVKGIETMLNRGAVKANPENPKAALEAYQNEFDALKLKLQSTLARIENELGENCETEAVQCVG